ncbi:MAG: hypothetical protein ACRDIL_08410, partial [Candidatus Limnocylindrales bacterium]
VFTARYMHLLSDPGLSAIDHDDLEVVDGDGQALPVSDRPIAGAIWCRLSRSSDGSHVMHLIDLLDQEDDRWDAPRRPPARRVGWRVRGGRFRSQRTVQAISPWIAGGDARQVVDGHLPTFRRWLVLVLSDA